MMILNVVNIRIIVMNVLYTKSYFEIRRKRKRRNKTDTKIQILSKKNMY